MTEPLTQLADLRQEEAAKSLSETALPNGEFANTVTHGFGLLLSVVGTVVLMSIAISHGNAWRLMGCGLFSVSLISVYAASTLSHAVSNPPLRKWFRALDQGLIYLLIVGSYTPFALVYHNTGWWPLFLGLMWIIALIGFISKILYTHRLFNVPLWSYLLLGWLPVIPTFVNYGSVPTDVWRWIIAGGICYTVGTIFLVVDIKRFHFHAIWHLFVIAGSVCHFLGILFFIASS